MKTNEYAKTLSKLKNMSTLLQLRMRQDRSTSMRSNNIRNYLTKHQKNPENKLGRFAYTGEHVSQEEKNEYLKYIRLKY